MNCPVFIVPGIGNSGPSHWQTLWQAAHSDWQRLSVDDWDHVVCDDWVHALERQLTKSGAETVVVAHSLGCLALAHWAARSSRTLRGALLVAVPDPASPAFPRTAATGFEPIPAKRLAFPSVIVASTNDPYGNLDHAQACAAAWGSELIEVREKGHLNADSNLGHWPEALQWLEKLRNR
ncbi:hypothetical protein C0Z18_29225 [Trinickia dabaoshanensis]|uniref:Alpha/beta hydrolase n=1 Tax=Trinickia dabaoshanensis TaxID=564714 RepID=A0A2N7VCU1_9BURK|nr:alpha/beta hydrolase [Trinickia dabaoshanensis]PMS14983.1 hypothetical protein C0Z18_29225 [Trinickia dabaoshanensis]